MSDGGKDNGKVSEPHNTRKPAGNEDFVRAIAKIAVAQICENEGFQGFQHSALEALADVAARFMRELGKTSNLYAHQAGRLECNVFDVIQGLEGLGSIQGFSGASDIHHSLANSGTIREISQYVSLVEGIPFVFSLPRFPISRERNPPSSFLQIGKDPPEHIPAWLPAFPFLEARGHSPGSGEKETNAVTANIEEEQEVEVPGKGEVDLMNIQQQQQPQQFTVNNGSEAVETNPFLAPPFQYGEKEVSSIELPCRVWEGNHINVMDTFAPVSETARNEVSEIEDTNKHIKLDGRPIVRLKFSSARKSLRTCKNVVAQTNGDERLAILFERNDENDEKKRRAEQILKESTETPLDTTEL